MEQVFNKSRLFLSNTSHCKLWGLPSCVGIQANSAIGNLHGYLAHVGHNHHLHLHAQVDYCLDVPLHDSHQDKEGGK